ncbi:MAG: DUF418 domain-containing protein [Bacillota bacterium]|jgi:uncharacterized protein
MTGNSRQGFLIRSLNETEKLIPVSGKERIVTLDIIRGFALLGILLVNMPLFMAPMLYVYPAETQWWTKTSDILADYFITIFAEGKFYTIFSFLFGYGFYIFMERAREKGRPVVKLYGRRILVLLFFGIMHITLLWWGDILHFYAVIGLFLLLFRNKTEKTLLIWSMMLIIIPIVIIGGFVALAAAVNGEDIAGYDFAQYLEEQVQTSLQVYSQGSFIEILRQRLSDFSFVAETMYVMAPQVLAMFLLGTYAARRRLIQDVDVNKLFLRKIWLWGLVVGIPFVFLQVTGKYNLLGLSFMASQFYYMAGTFISGVAICFFYMTTIIFLLQKPDMFKILAPLGDVGRMALTNYLLQSIIATTIFYSYGLGLFGRVGPAWGIVLTLLIFMLQVYFSRYWMKKYHFGPLEWLWRTLTYGKLG